MQAIFHVPDMHCDGCAKSVVQALEVLNGVENVNTDTTTRTVTINYDAAQLDSSTLSTVIENAGFDISQD